MQLEFEEHQDRPQLIIEPGTALVADTMQFVCQVQEVKTIRGQAIAMTSGTKVNFNPMSSTINMPMAVYSDEHKEREQYDSIDISGYTCMEGDYLHRDYRGRLAVGDFISIKNAGSYSVVLSHPLLDPMSPLSP